jgi:hypothetical protein
MSMRPRRKAVPLGSRTRLRRVTVAGQCWSPLSDQRRRRRFAIGYIQATLLAPDPATTAANIQAHQLLCGSSRSV